MTRKAAVFCHNGLGDGIISLVLSNNLHLNAWQIDTFHNGLEALQEYFPHLPILNYPNVKSVSDVIKEYDLLLVFHNDTFEFVLKLIEIGKREAPEKIKIIYPYPTKGIALKPYYDDSRIQPSIPIVKNLRNFVKDILKLPKVTKSNGFIAPRNFTFKKFPKRVALHVSSSRPGKNWPIEKYVLLAKMLKQKGYDPVFIAGGKKERKPYEWLVDEGFFLPFFENLNDVAKFLYESAYFIGNDSGLGHLASCMGIPTVTISRRRAVASFWSPGWAPSCMIVPSSLIPNISGFRLRDRRWKQFISARKVFKGFNRVIKKAQKNLQNLT